LLASDATFGIGCAAAVAVRDERGRDSQEEESNPLIHDARQSPIPSTVHGSEREHGCESGARLAGAGGGLDDQRRGEVLMIA
jgi:hypothetical protein